MVGKAMRGGSQVKAEVGWRRPGCTWSAPETPPSTAPSPRPGLPRPIQPPQSQMKPHGHRAFQGLPKSKDEAQPSPRAVRVLATLPTMSQACRLCLTQTPSSFSLLGSLSLEGTQPLQPGRGFPSQGEPQPEAGCHGAGPPLLAAPPSAPAPSPIWSHFRVSACSPAGRTPTPHLGVRPTGYSSQAPLLTRTATDTRLPGQCLSPAVRAHWGLCVP